MIDESVVLDDDVVQLTLSGFTTTETNGTQTANFTVTLNRPAEYAIVITFSTSDGTANAGSDYTSQSAISYTIPAGSTSIVIPVDVLGDGISEPTETFLGTIGVTDANGQQYSVVTPTATSTILDNDVIELTLLIRFHHCLRQMQFS